MNEEKNVMVCSVCGQVIQGKEFQEHEGKIYCEDCFCDQFVICDECGEIIPRNESNWIEGYDIEVCNYCFDNEFTVCANCDTIIRRDDSYHSVDGNICSYCADEYYYICDDCGERVYRDNGSWDENGNYWYCDECYGNNTTIRSYHSSHCRDRIFYGGEDNGENLFEGVELEIDDGEDRNETAKAMKEVMPSNFISMEFDGSLDCGFENITEPATLDYHLSIKDKYQKMFDIALENGFRSHNTTTCGYHIHFNRSFFGDKQDENIAKLLYLVEKFWDELVKFSRRNYERLERWAKKYDDTPELVVKKMKERNLDRYHAINLTNSATIEFRMFRGTLKIDTFLATLELVDNIVKYVKHHTNNEIQSMEFTDLLTTDRLVAYWETVKNRRS